MIAQCPSCGEAQTTFADPKGWGNIKCRRCGKTRKTKYWKVYPEQINPFILPPSADVAFVTADKIPRGNFAKSEVRE